MAYAVIAEIGGNGRKLYLVRWRFIFPESFAGPTHYRFVRRFEGSGAEILRFLSLVSTLRIPSGREFLALTVRWRGFRDILSQSMP
jgi:hypothetical protein